MKNVHLRFLVAPSRPARFQDQTEQGGGKTLDAEKPGRGGSGDLSIVMGVTPKTLAGGFL